MPPFKLEAPERSSKHGRNAKIIYTKNSYSEGVKVVHWQELLEHHPIDVDPHCPGKVNYFLSHYNRLGTISDKEFTTTTGEMLKQVFIKDKMIPNKLMHNYYTYNDNAECLTEYPTEQCPTICVNDYMTTMQHSYRIPKPHVIPRLAFPKIPFMQNRKYKHETPELCTDKFYGEDFDNVTCQLRKHKGFRWVSYNPLIGSYTDVAVKEDE